MNHYHSGLKKEEFLASVIQVDIINGAIQENFKKIAAQIESLKEGPVSLTVLPEMFSCGFDNELLLKHASESDVILGKLCGMAAEYNMAIAGSLPEAIGDDVYNTMYFIDRDGDIKGSYRKMHLFRPTSEHLFFKASDEVTVLETSFGKIGLAICYDLRFPELFRMLMEKGADIILICAQWPEPRISHWRTLVQARAIENQLYMICSNRTGSDGTLNFTGNSMIVDPGGNIIADAGTTEGNARGRVDLALITATRKSLPVLDDRRLDLYGHC